MPTSIPPNRPDAQRPGGAAEALVWDALMAQLSDGWFIFHGLRLLSGEARARELDFVLVHRLHGMLTVECKGAGLQRERSGRWVRVGPDGRRSPAKDPVAQVESARHALVAAMTERWHAKTGDGRIPLVHGHAVITPRATHRSGSALPLALRSELCWTADDLPKIAGCVERALSFWRQAATYLPPTLDTDAFRRFRRTCLQPVLQLTPGLRARMAAQEAALMRVSDQQQTLLRGLLVNPRLHVIGPAGSGKTVL
ncbi:MAG: NERD domain-containing protein, partial [Myxococcales bacterium]|nr:NERD domain-containing protein [Myxococcales bacterium]